ncbi:MAG: hypothetical protein AAB631_03165 [Patescibacteria group bacterium]
MLLSKKEREEIILAQIDNLKDSRWAAGAQIEAAKAIASLLQAEALEKIGEELHLLVGALKTGRQQ